jgi:hypothetical protein
MNRERGGPLDFLVWSLEDVVDSSFTSPVSSYRMGNRVCNLACNGRNDDEYLR